MGIPFTFDPEIEMAEALYLLRVYAYLFIPANASIDQAGEWLKAHAPDLNEDDRKLISVLHASGDKVLSSWRTGDGLVNLPV